MRLSRQDRRALDEIGRGLRSDDPGLATALTATTDADADRRVWLAWPALWIGWVAMIAGSTDSCSCWSQPPPCCGNSRVVMVAGTALGWTG
jgi:hypothetical protein